MASLYFILIGRHQLVAEAPEEQLFLAEDSTLLSP
jgi:hypothetical protein